MGELVGFATDRPLLVVVLVLIAAARSVFVIGSPNARQSTARTRSPAAWNSGAAARTSPEAPPRSAPKPNLRQRHTRAALTQAASPSSGCAALRRAGAAFQSLPRPSGRPCLRHSAPSTRVR